MTHHRSDKDGVVSIGPEDIEIDEDDMDFDELLTTHRKWAELFKDVSPRMASLHKQSADALEYLMDERRKSGFDSFSWGPY